MAACALVAHPSRLAEDGEDLRMTAQIHKPDKKKARLSGPSKSIQPNATD
jgi:hypothetical protein